MRIEFSGALNRISAQDKKILERAILEWTHKELNTRSEWKLAHLLNKWIIFVHHQDESNLAEFQALVGGAKLDSGIPHGITLNTVREVHVFIPNNGGLGLLQAFTAIGHELAHMILSELVNLNVLPQRSRRRYADKLAKAGTEGNTETTEVHDRIYEMSTGVRKPKVFVMKKYRLWIFFIQHIEFRAIDITDLINKLETL